MSEACHALGAAPQALYPAPERCALLVAPDDPSRAHLAQLLNGWGFQVTASDHPLAAAAHLYQGWEQAQPFHLVLFSPHGHAVDPGAFAALILADRRAAKLALVHLGEVDDIGTRGRLRQAGYLDFLPDATDTRVVFETVQWALGRQTPPPADQSRVVNLSERQARWRAGQRRVEILIADPDAAHRRIARHALADEKRRLTEVASGEALLAALDRRTFDIVILALDCGDYLAGELMGVVRMAAANDHCPVFIGVGDPTLVQDEDFAAVVDLPLRAHPLTRAVQAVTRSAAAAPAEPPPAPIPRLDQRALSALHRINPSPEFLPRVIRDFLSQVERDIQHLRHCSGRPLCHRKLLDFGHELADMAGHLGALELHQLGLIAASYPEQLFDSQGHQLIGHIETSFARTREELLPYLHEQGAR